MQSGSDLRCSWVRAPCPGRRARAGVGRSASAPRVRAGSGWRRCTEEAATAWAGTAPLSQPRPPPPPPQPQTGSRPPGAKSPPAQHNRARSQGSNQGSGLEDTGLTTRNETGTEYEQDMIGPQAVCAHHRRTTQADRDPHFGAFSRRTLDTWWRRHAAHNDTGWRTCPANGHKDRTTRHYQLVRGFAASVQNAKARCKLTIPSECGRPPET